MNDTSRGPTIAQQRKTPLRAIIEIIDGELVIQPIAFTDEETAEILDALRFLGKKDRAAA